MPQQEKEKQAKLFYIFFSCDFEKIFLFFTHFAQDKRTEEGWSYDLGRLHTYHQGLYGNCTTENYKTCKKKWHHMRDIFIFVAKCFSGQGKGLEMLAGIQQGEKLMLK